MTTKLSLNKEYEAELPKEFEAYTQELFGEERYRKYLKGLTESAPVSIRLNPFKLSEDESINSNLSPERVPWCDEGYWLSRRPDFTFDPLLHAGVYYVQEASSMFLSHVLRHWVKNPVLALDLCAAPGGKTTCARTALPAGSFLFQMNR